jgi:hypothetical protein
MEDLEDRPFVDGTPDKLFLHKNAGKRWESREFSGSETLGF